MAALRGLPGRGARRAQLELGPGAELRVAHTCDLDGATLEAVRRLLHQGFGAEMTEQGWDHALGGMHVLIWESDQLVGHAAVVQRRLLHRDRARRAGYVEGVVVRADRRGHGYGGALMDAVETIIRGAYELGALGATELGAGFYAARGWKAWRGQTWALSPAGRVRAKAEYGGLYVLEVAVPLELTGELTCDWREGHLW